MPAHKFTPLNHFNGLSAFAQLAAPPAAIDTIRALKRVRCAVLVERAKLSSSASSSAITLFFLLLFAFASRNSPDSYHQDGQPPGLGDEPRIRAKGSDEPKISPSLIFCQLSRFIDQASALGAPSQEPNAAATPDSEGFGRLEGCRL
ncbi:MAG TPA: hypothetical protein VGG79_15710 [Roseiarcus sp.]